MLIGRCQKIYVYIYIDSWCSKLKVQNISQLQNEVHQPICKFAYKMTNAYK